MMEPREYAVFLNAERLRFTKIRDRYVPSNAQTDAGYRPLGTDIQKIQKEKIPQT